MLNYCLNGIHKHMHAYGKHSEYRASMSQFFSTTKCYEIYCNGFCTVGRVPSIVSSSGPRNVAQFLSGGGNVTRPLPRPVSVTDYKCVYISVCSVLVCAYVYICVLL